MPDRAMQGMETYVYREVGTPQYGSNRVLRGGSWINNAQNLRSAYRNHNAPDNRNHNIGLRLAGALLLLDQFFGAPALRKDGGSINQRSVQFVSAIVCRSKQILRPQRVSRDTKPTYGKSTTERLLLGRFSLPWLEADNLHMNTWKLRYCAVLSWAWSSALCWVRRVFFLISSNRMVQIRGFICNGY